MSLTEFSLQPFNEKYIPCWKKKINLPFVVLIKKTNVNQLFTQFGDQYEPLRGISHLALKIG